MTASQPDRVAWETYFNVGAVTTTPSHLLPGGSRWETLLESTRTFLDLLAGSAPDDGTALAVATDLDRISDRLRRWAVPEAEQAFGHRPDIEGLGQTLTPRFAVVEREDSAIRCRAEFGRYHLGVNGAAMGGAIPLLYDAVIGRLVAKLGRVRSRTAYLNVSYRNITPIEKPLEVRAWMVREEGRKLFIAADVRDGDIVCSEAECLFVSLRDDQP